MSKLPPAWAEATLGDFATIVLGQSPPGRAYNTEGRGLPFFQGKAEFGALRPEVRKWTTEATKTAEPDDVLLSVRAPVGPVNLAPGKCAIGRGLAALRPVLGEPRYLLYAMRATAGVLAEKATGSTFTAVTGAQVRCHHLPIAPENEQLRIVAAIEEQFSRLDAAEGTLEQAALKLAQLRASVINMLMDEGAPIRRLGDVATLADGPFGSNLKTAHYTQSGPRVIRLQNIGHGVFLDEHAHISEEHFQRLVKYSVEAGDVVAASLGDDTPRACLVPEWLGPAVVKADCIRVRPSDGLSSRYLMWILNADAIKKAAAASIRGIGRPRLGVSGLRALRIPVPPMRRQERIVAEIERRLTVTDAMKAGMVSARSQGVALRRSILERAFRGELVPQDPSDEPADALLERIRAERAAEAPARRSGRRKEVGSRS